MKRLATAVAVGLIATPAFAADIAVKAPYAPAPAPVYNWTGWYVGVNAGASFGSVKTDFNGTPIFGATIDQITPGFAFSDRSYPDGFMGGGQIGYNWQWSPLIVVGLEADFQGALEKDTNNLSQSFNFASGLNTCTGCTAVTNYTTEIDWFGTVRARIGYVWGNGQVMSYLTGGLAYGEVKINGTNNVNGSVACCGGGLLLNSATQAFGQSHVNTGWVAGYGTEGVIDFWGARNWTWKIEGLYMDLGHLDTTGVATGVSCTPVCPTLTGGQVTTHTHFTDGILRGGLNYKFY